MYNVQFTMYNYFELLFADLMMAVKSLINSLQSVFKLSYDLLLIISDALNKFNQYSDSLASFNDMFNLLIKSFVEEAFCASVMLHQLKFQILIFVSILVLKNDPHLIRIYKVLQF